MDPIAVADAPPPPPSPAPVPRLVLELGLAPDDARRLPLLLRGCLLRGAGRRRAVPLRLIWHDTPDFDLAAEGLALAERQQGRETSWRLERILPEAGTAWSPGTPRPVLAEAAELAALGVALPAGLTRVAGFEGQARTLYASAGLASAGHTADDCAAAGHAAAGPAPDGVELTLISGTLRAAAAARPHCGVVLDGPADAVAALARLLAGRLHLHVPAASLPAEAMEVAGRTAPNRRHAGPALPPDQPVGEAFARLVAQLTEVILSEAARAGPAQAEPVHQMRVALRRLRSATGLFGRAVRCPELDACNAGLKALARTLGPARDWDVFVGGTARAVAANFAEDRAVRRLLDAAERRRQAAYVALKRHLASADFRRLGIALSVLAASRPWEAVLEPGLRAPGDEEAARQAERLAGPLAGLAARALERRLRPLREPGADIDALPTATLHGLRLHGKRLRYACEFFVPLFPGRGARRFIRRLAVLQERLGHLNDGAVAAGLMAELGAAHGYAGGVVLGFVAAQAAGSRARIGRCWRKFHRLDPFWD